MVNVDDLITILVTGAGAPGIRGTIYALRNNPDQHALRIVGVDIRSDVAGRFLVDRFYQVPSPEDPDYLEVLSQICKREHVNVVIPQTTREVDVLSHHKEDLTSQGIPVMVSDWCAIQVANHKLRLLQEFERQNLPSPVFRLVRSEDGLRECAHELGYPERPVVVKPPSSNGMRGVRILKRNAWDLHRFLTEKPSGLEISLRELLVILRRGPKWPELLVMEYLPGPEYSVDVFRGERLEVAIPRLRKSVRSGITFEAALDFRDDLISSSLQAARHIDLRYAFGFQFKVDERGVPKILECNPRVQGTMVASLFSSVNVIWLGVKESLGESPIGHPQELKPALFYRFWGGVGLCEGRTHEI